MKKQSVLKSKESKPKKATKKKKPFKRIIADNEYDSDAGYGGWGA